MLIRKFKPKPTKTSFAASLELKLKKMEKIEKPKLKKRKIKSNFQSDLEEKILLHKTKNLTFGYDIPLAEPLTIDIYNQDKICVMGQNGSGKTTLIKTILGEIEPISGKVIVGSKVKMGYISQNTLLEGNNSVIEYLTENMVNVNYSLVFTLLEKIGISYEDKDKIYSKLSPGERTRLAIVKLALLKTNVLILDEVTNHLDKEALNLIYELIRGYEGTIISISHNRKYNEILDADVLLDMGTGVVENLKLTKNL